MGLNSHGYSAHYLTSLFGSGLTVVTRWAGATAALTGVLGRFTGIRTLATAFAAVALLPFTVDAT